MAKKSKDDAGSFDYSRKKKKIFDVDTNIKVAYKTGNIIYGQNNVLRELRQNTFKMIVIANNCPKDLEDKLNYNNTLIKESDRIFIHKYFGSSWDLGLALAKPYMISVVGILDYGDSDLITLKTKNN